MTTQIIRKNVGSYLVIPAFMQVAATVAVSLVGGLLKLKADLQLITVLKDLDPIA